MHCDFVNPLREVQWNKWVQEQSNATFFHTAEWAQVLSETYNYDPHYAVLREDKRTVGVLPIMEVRSMWTGCRGISLPFSDECTPLLARGVTLAEVIEPVRAYGLQRGWSHLEFRGGAETLPSAVRSGEFALHNLPLEVTEELQFKKLRNSASRNIQKSIREGVQVERLQTREAMDVFYALHSDTRRHHGLPPQPLRFFHLIHQHVIEKGSGFVSLARYGKRWIAGAVFFEFGCQAVYKFGASDRHFQHLRANNLVMWDAICHFQRKHIPELSLGRSRLQDEGLMRFKRSWGALESRLAYHQIGLKKEVRATNFDTRHGPVWLPKLIQWVPLSVLRLVGRLAYRHIA
jgi:Acetyltransferase (GNAT) domain